MSANALNYVVFIFPFYLSLDVSYLHSAIPIFPFVLALAFVFTVPPSYSFPMPPYANYNDVPESVRVCMHVPVSGYVRVCVLYICGPIIYGKYKCGLFVPTVEMRASEKHDYLLRELYN